MFPASLRLPSAPSPTFLNVLAIRHHSPLPTLVRTVVPNCTIQLSFPHFKKVIQVCAHLPFIILSDSGCATLVFKTFSPHPCASWLTQKTSANITLVIWVGGREKKQEVQMYFSYTKFPSWNFVFLVFPILNAVRYKP
jgi:hypothetical protein